MRFAPLCLIWTRPRAKADCRVEGESVSRPDRDASYGQCFQERAQAMGTTEIAIAPRSPWQNAYVERIIGSIRRECLDHIIVINERHLRRVLSSYIVYYHHSRTHLSLAKDCPDPRAVRPPSSGRVIAVPQAGGLHHRYERSAA